MPINLRKDIKMSQELQKYDTNYIIYEFDDSVSVITEEQFQNLGRVLVEPGIKFVKVNGELINISSIKKIGKYKPMIGEKYITTGGQVIDEETLRQLKKEKKIEVISDKDGWITQIKELNGKN